MIPNEAHAAAREIVHIIPLVMHGIASRLRQTDHPLQPPHLSLLGRLAHCPCNLSELAEQHAVSSATMSNMVTTLEERGWVKRERLSEDRRVVLVDLTPEGHDVLVAVHRQMEEHLAELLASLSREEYDTLLAGLAILRKVFQEASPHKSDD